jgi:hypothetical protein
MLPIGSVGIVIGASFAILTALRPCPHYIVLRCLVSDIQGWFAQLVARVYLDFHNAEVQIPAPIGRTTVSKANETGVRARCGLPWRRHFAKFGLHMYCQTPFLWLVARATWTNSRLHVGVVPQPAAAAWSANSTRKAGTLPCPDRVLIVHVEALGVSSEREADSPS